MLADTARAVAADPNPAGSVATRRGAKDERFQCHPYPVLHGAGFQTSPGKGRSGRLGVGAQIQVLDRYRQRLDDACVVAGADALLELCDRVQRSLAVVVSAAED